MREASGNTELEEKIFEPFWFYEGKKGNGYTTVNGSKDYITFVWKIYIPSGHYKSLEELEEEVKLTSPVSSLYDTLAEKIIRNYPEQIIDKGEGVIFGERVKYLTIQYRDFKPKEIDSKKFTFKDLIWMMKRGRIPEDSFHLFIGRATEVIEQFRNNLPKDYFYKNEVSSLQKKLDDETKNQDFWVFVDKNGNEVISGNEEELKEKGCKWVPLNYLATYPEQQEVEKKKWLLRYFKKLKKR